MEYLKFANSTTMLILCSIPVIYVTVQAILFYKIAHKRGIEIGMDKKDLKRVAISSGVFTIVPALPILIFLVILAPSLGKFFPWLRLSVVGSGAYENIVANSALSALGFENFEQLDMQGFVVIMLTMTVSIIAGLLGTIFILKPYSKKISNVQSNPNGFGKHLVPSIFIGLVVAIGAPYFFPKEVVIDGNKDLVLNLIGILAFLTGFLTFLGVSIIAKNTKNRALGEFAFPLSIVIGMLVAIVFAQLGIGVIKL